MGTYTANYQLYMPTVGEQGWGDLMNGNLTTIDTTMKGLNTRMGTAETNITSLTTRMGTAETTIASNKSRIGTLETETDAMKEKLDNISFESDGTLKSDSVKVKKLYVVPELSTQHGDIVYATNTQPSLSVDQQNTASAGTKTTSTITVNGYAIKSGITFPLKVGTGMYIENNSDLVIPKLTGLTATFYFYSYEGGWGKVYKNGQVVCQSSGGVSGVTKTFTVNEGDKIYVQHSAGVKYGDYYMVFSLTIAKAPDLRIW